MFPAAGNSGQSAIPEKLYFRIGEVSQLVGVEPHVLRYWETEFPSISPRKAGGSHRLYRRKDVEILLQIKDLLYEKRYTIQGARQFLKGSAKTPAVKVPRKVEQRDLFEGDRISSIRRELSGILELLR